MFDVKARQKHLQQRADMLDSLCMYFDEDFNDEFDAEIFAFESDTSFSNFIECAAAFSIQFAHRAAMYDEPPFANASSDAELRDAASRQYSTAHGVLSERQKTKNDERWAEWRMAECDFILHALEQRGNREGSNGLE